MQNRERGAAHINIYFFLVVLVLFLASLYFGYVQMSQVNGARAERKDAILEREAAKRDLLHYKHYIEEISGIVGKQGDWNGKDGFVWKDRFTTLPEAERKPAKLTAVAVPADVKRALSDLAIALKMPASESSPIGPFFGKIDSAYRDDQSAVAAAKAQAAKSATDLATAQRGFQQASSKATQDLNKANANFTKLVGDLRTANGGLQTRLTNAQRQVRTVNEEKQALTEQHQVDVTKKQKEIDRQKGQNSALVATLKFRNPPQEADGHVISALMRVNRAWIDIGKKDMLTKGTMFRITGRDGKKIKAHGRVITLNQDRAELQLTGVVDAIGDPISKGDKLFNNLYSPNLKRNVAMIGRFSHPYSKPMIKALLQKHGNKVFDEVKIGVDLVIVGLQNPTAEGDGLEPIENTPGYKKAQEYSCEIITIQKIRDLLELSDG